MVTVAEIREAIRERKARSAWDKGLKEYAEELLDDVKEGRKLGENDELGKLTEKELLNGATDWQEFSEGGGSLIYDEDICARLYPPSVRKNRKNGELPPNGRENWIDVQARALWQASRRLRRLIAAYERKEG